MAGRPKARTAPPGGCGGPHRAVTIYTDGACKGNPGPGGWGALLIAGDRVEGALRRRARDDQQPHGADRGDPRAREPDARLRRRAVHRLPVRQAGHRELDPRLEAQRLEDRGPQAGEERGAVARARAAGRTPSRALALGARPQRGCGQRARRRARESWRRRGAGTVLRADYAVRRLRQPTVHRAASIRFANTVISFSACRSPFSRATSMPRR